MILQPNDKVVIRVAGEILQYGDIAIIKMVKDRSEDKPYYCYCALRKLGEWFSERHLDKVKPKTYLTKPIHKTSSIPDIKFYTIEKKERPPAEYNNLSSPLKVYKE